MQKNMSKAAKLFIKTLFDDDEIVRSTLSGRKNTKQLDTKKLEAIGSNQHISLHSIEHSRMTKYCILNYTSFLITELVWWMHDKTNKDPYAFDPQNAPSPPEHEMTEVRRKAFVETRNELSRKRRNSAEDTSMGGDLSFASTSSTIKRRKSSDDE
jgi:hypothetical protein